MTWLAYVCVGLLIIFPLCNADDNCPWSTNDVQPCLSTQDSLSGQTIPYGGYFSRDLFSSKIEEDNKFLAGDVTCSGIPGVSFAYPNVQYSPGDNSGVQEISCTAPACEDSRIPDCTFPEVLPKNHLEYPPSNGDQPRNEYWPGVSASEGSNIIELGPSEPGQSIVPGDVLLVVQMSGAIAASTNHEIYSDNIVAGVYEYVIAEDEMGAGGGTLQTTVLQNSYTVHNWYPADLCNFVLGVPCRFTERFQVVKVIRATNVTIPEDVVVRGTPWNPSKGIGGIVAIDTDPVEGHFVLNGHLDLNGCGFHGGWGSGFGLPGDANSHRNLGDGVLGTPEHTYHPSLGKVDVDGYSFYEGLFGQAANENYANAGGWAYDDQLGGGGGSNGLSTGGGGALGGTSLKISDTTRMYMGGGGGAGLTWNDYQEDDLGSDDNEAVHSGQAGGGMAFIRAGRISGAGRITANGLLEQPQWQTDAGGGGGGAGGSILLYALGPISGVELSALGGQGGSSVNGGGGHGGSGGIIVTVSSSFSDIFCDTTGGPGGFSTQNEAGSAGGNGRHLEFFHCCNITVAVDVTVCARNQYPDSGGVCQDCSVGCARCNDTGQLYDSSSGPCLECAGPFDLFRRNCLPVCPNGQALPDGSDQCQLVITSPDPSTTVSFQDRHTFEVVGTGGAGAQIKVTVSIGGNELTDTITSPQNDWSTTFDLAPIYFSDSPFINVTAFATSGGDNSPTTSAYATIPIQVTITSPQSGINVNAQEDNPFTVTGTCNKPTVMVTLTGSEDDFVSDLSCDDTTGQWTVSVSESDMIELGEGTVQITAFSEDDQNSQEDERSFTYDPFPPSVTIDGPLILNSQNVASAMLDGYTDIDVQTLQAFIQGGSSFPISDPHEEGGFLFFNQSSDFTSAPEGSFTLTVEATDDVGNQGTDSITVQKDTIPPSLEILSPANQTWVNKVTASSFSVTGTSDGVQVQFFHYANLVSFAAPEANNWSFDFPLDAYLDGPVEFLVLAVDDFDNGVTEALTVRLDRTPPTLHILSPANFTQVFSANQSNVVITGESDEENVLLTIDASGEAPLSIPVTGGSFSTSLNLTALPDGPITITAQVTDPAGNTVQDETTVDKFTVPSEVTITTPTAGQTFNAVTASSVLISGTTDGWDLEVELSGANSLKRSLDIDDENWSRIFDLSGFSDGRVDVFATVTWPNPGSAQSYFFLDQTPPVLSILAPEQGSFVNQFNVKSLELMGTVDSPEGSQVRLTVDNRTRTLYTNSSGYFNTIVDLTTFSEGPILINASTADAAGNPTSEQVEVIKDTISPALSIELPLEGVGFNATGARSVLIRGTIDESLPLSVNVTDSRGDFLFKSIPENTLVERDFGWRTTFDLTELTDGSIEIIVRTRDVAGNPTMTQRSVILDKLPPVLSLDAPATGDFINLANYQAVTFAGSLKDAISSTNTLNVIYGDARHESTLSDGRFTITHDFSSVPDGRVSLTLEVTDEVGNQEASSLLLQKDTVAPQPSIAVVAGSDVINQEMMQSGLFVLRGTGEPASIVEIVLRRGDTLWGPYSASTDRNGRWTFSPAKMEMDGAQVNVTVRSWDPAGNMGASSRTILIDTVPPQVTIDSISGDGVIRSEEADAVIVSGTALGADTVDLSFEDTYLNVVIADGVEVVDGVWSTTVNLQRLRDGSLLVEAQVRDPAGNDARADRRITKIPPSASGTPTPSVTPSSSSSASTSVLPSRTASPSRSLEPVVILPPAPSAPVVVVPVSSPRVTLGPTLVGAPPPCTSCDGDGTSFPVPPTNNGGDYQVVDENGNPIVVVTVPDGFSQDDYTLSITPQNGGGAEITLRDSLDNEISTLPADLQICLSSQDNRNKEDLCLGYLNEATGRWECEDPCVEQNQDGLFCGSTGHLTNFALLLSGGNGDPCGSDEDYLIAWISLAFICAALCLTFVAAILVEIRVRIKHRESHSRKRPVVVTDID